MMNETVVEKPFCAACGADVRAGSLFCYNCGSAVAEADNIPAENEVSVDATTARTNGAVPAKEILPGSRGPMVTAAGLRRRPKSRQVKPKEIVWEAREERTDGLFIVTTIGLLIFAIAAVVVALYFK